MTVIAALLVSAATQTGPLDRAREALGQGDTIAALAALEPVARVTVPSRDPGRAGRSVEPTFEPEALRALMLLQWIARSRTQDDARDRWEAETALLGEAYDMPSDIAVDIAFIARWLERGAPLRPAAWEVEGRTAADQEPQESWKRVARIWNLAESDGPTMLRQWAKYVLAQWDLAWLDGALLSVPPRTRDSWRCPANRDAWCVVRDPSWTRGQIGRLVEADTVLEPVLRRLEVALWDAAAAPWPLSELALRMRIGLQLALYPRSSDAMIEDRVRTADLPVSVQAELLATLAAFGGQPRRADSIMQRHAAAFTRLDGELRMFQTGELSPAAFWLAAWPMYLEPYNARLLAHRARLLLADMLDRMVPGEGGFGLFPGRRGVVLRGIPEDVYRLRDTSSVSWEFGDVIRSAEFVEIVDPAMHETVLPMWRARQDIPALDLALAARTDERIAAPSGFVSRSYQVMRDFEHQLVRLVRDGVAWLEFYAERPTVCPSERPVLGFFLLDPRFRIVRRHVDSAAARTWRYRLRVPADTGTYLYSLELLDHGCATAARARYLTTVAPAATTGISDLVLAHERRTPVAVRVSDRLPVTPRHGLVVTPDEPVHLYWELYGLATRGDERDRLTVTVQVVDVRRTPVPVQLLGEVARAARDRPTALDTRYAVTVPAGAGPLGMTVSLQLPPDAEGIYVARVMIEDRAGRRPRATERAFRVTRGR